ncbi:MAG: hypothetical protein ACRELY_23025 [Polyangiaceae bacterium]
MKKRWLIASLATAVSVITAACGSSGGSTFVNGDDGGVGNGDDGSGGGGGNDGGFVNGNDSGPPSNGGDAGLNACAADTQAAKLAPLDLVFMQDTSGSMSEYVSAYNDVPPITDTKYASVKKALAAFMSDPSSSGIGMGIQYFPKFTGSAPNECTTNAQCPGGTGPCYLKSCTSRFDAFNPCTSNSDCVTSCVQNGVCHNNPDFICHVGTACGTDPNTGNDLGACDAFGTWYCANETTTCTDTDYSSLDVSIAALPGVAAAVTTSLNAHLPNGDTPTSAALQGAIEAAKAYATAHSSDIVAVVFSTDGVPTNCDQTAGDIENIAAAGLAGTPSVKTFVIGVLSPADATATATSLLNGIASSGGTTSATIIGTSSTTESDFVSALTKIRGQSLPCQFDLPVPEAGTPDYSKVNVVYTDSATMNASIVPYVADLADCSADGGVDGGWYYDHDPFADAGTPTKVELCPATCSAVQADPAGTVDVVQGCKTSTGGGGPPR